MVPLGVPHPHGTVQHMELEGTHRGLPYIQSLCPDLRGLRQGRAGVAAPGIPLVITFHFLQGAETCPRFLKRFWGRFAWAPGIHAFQWCSGAFRAHGEQRVPHAAADESTLPLFSQEHRGNVEGMWG